MATTTIQVVKTQQLSWRLLLRLGASLYAIALCFYLLCPPDAFGMGAIRTVPGQDLTARALAHGGLALLLCLALGTSGPARRAGLVAMLSTAYAGLMEAAQSVLSWRTTSAWDMVADVIGIAVAAGVWLIWQCIWPPRSAGQKAPGRTGGD